MTTSPVAPLSDVAAEPLRDVAAALSTDSAFARIAGKRNAVVAIPEIARAAAVSALAHVQERRPIIVATPTGTVAQQLFEDLTSFFDARDIAFFPAWETLPFERVSPGIETMSRRIETMWRLINDDHAPQIVVTPVRALSQKLSPSLHAFNPISISVSSAIDIEKITQQLAAFGYRRETIVEHRGEFARRGSIIDVFPGNADEPIRIDMWGDEVDRLTTFNIDDQRSTTELSDVTVFPVREVLIDEKIQRRARSLIESEPWGREQWERLAEGQLFDGMESWLPWLVEKDNLLTDVLPKDALLIFVEPRRMMDRARDILAEEDDLARALATTWARDQSVEFPRLHTEPERLLSDASSITTVSITSTADNDDAPAVAASSWGPMVSDPDALTRNISQLLADDWSVLVTAETPEALIRITSLFSDRGLDVPIVDTSGLSSPSPDSPHALSRPGARATIAPLAHGMSLPSAKIAIVTEGDISGRRRTRSFRRRSARSSAALFENLQPGNFIVHAHHGVGLYEGMVKRSIGGVERDYLLLSYKGGDKLYVPTDQIDAVRQYIGGETPTLHRLGGSDFARTKSRVRSAVREVAQELVVLYQKRVNVKGHVFAPDTPWQQEMEQRFPFIETPDQLRAIRDIKQDMEQEVPMDRLLCGDVGFGKTEVAIRSAFKAIQDGKQVAVLVPTTLLATQHGNTFSERFAGYPIRVEVLSRFLTAGEAKKVIAGITSGEVDCVIGTHRLLQDNVKFKDLGLLIVDEEQRFGVQHKEAMKRMRTNVDVLTMSATPIPRTLEMSLVGIRDMSLLQTPPADRQPILTYVGEDNDKVAAEAIRRELLREGQVFWVHNRVASIDDRAQYIRELVPEARVAVAHGQMDEAALEQVVVDFWEGNYDVLVCTTIIESGIDMPTVNTLVVERADLLGLGQLHQLRGRVGRSDHRAYAYLFHPADKTLTEEAYERLRTIGEATELGSGFKIAMRDLEIRGAGNLLGESQSGHIAAVGYDLYCQMVTEAVAEMKGEEPQTPEEIKIDIPVDAFLPETYVPTAELRLEAYRRLGSVTSLAQVADISQEWIDRYGPMPEPAQALLHIGSLRALCHQHAIREIVSAGRDVRLTPVDLRASQEMTLRRLAPGYTHRSATRQLSVPVPRKGNIVEHLAMLINELFGTDDQ
jgi:transcription-repair coupling factor (superfamily II helicase)